jgi:hypothetical protein
MLEPADPPIFLADQHPISRRWAIFEDDERSGWLYLTEIDQPGIVGDCWIYNRVPAPDPSEVEALRQGPPPAARGFAGAEALAIDPDTSRIAFRWAEDGRAVALLIDGEPLGFLIAGERRGISRNLARSGPWGQTWDQTRYDRVFI